MSEYSIYVLPDEFQAIKKLPIISTATIMSRRP